MEREKKNRKDKDEQKKCNQSFGKYLLGYQYMEKI